MVMYESIVQVKSVPLSGTGKHKYSFQRVEVPPLPIHFCDCEEHSVDFHSAKEKQTCDVEAQSRGMNEEEINIMNSVMNKLFKREKVSDTAHSGNGLTKERDNSAKSIHGLQVDENEADSATDEDNLIINVVTRKSNKMALFGGQEKERISENQVEFKVQLVEYTCILCFTYTDYLYTFWPKFLSVLDSQDSGFSGTRTSRDGQNQNALKEQKRNTVPPHKKRKSLNQESDDNGSLSAITRGKGKLKTHSDESAALLGAQLAKPDSGIQKSDTVVYWSQKSSWRNLVGDKGNTSFSVSHILPSEEQQPKNGSSVPDSIVSKNKNLVRHGDHLESHSGETIEEEVMETQPAKPSAASSKSVSDFIVSKNENLVIHRDHLESPSGETIEEEEVTETQPAKPSAASSKSVSDSIVNKNENLVTHGDHLESLSGETIEEVVTETQPAKTSAASSNSGRGASWLKKSSWTQLISENNNSSFSIAQVLPGISYEKQVQAEPSNVDIVDSTNGEHSDLRKDDNSKSPGNVSTILVIEKDRNIVRSTPEKNQQTIVGNNEAPSPISERKLNSAPKVTSARSITIGETCSFMRSAASLKEWSKVKASVSGSLKRKSGGK